MPQKFRQCVLLFYTFAKIAACVLGGGLAMLPVIEETFSNKRKLLSRDELLEMVALSQTVPGIVAANCAVYVGMKVAGIFGAVAALSGAVLPSFCVILAIAVFFPGLNPHHAVWIGIFKGARAAVTALIVYSACKMAKNVCRAPFEIFVGATVLILALCRVHPGWLVLGTVPLGLLVCRSRGKGGDS